MATWNHPGDSVYGLAARSHRVVDTMEDLLGGEVYHYHSKLTAKEPEVGGAWEWHQDYGYWYHNGCVFPLMASVMVALDASNRENGCLRMALGGWMSGAIFDLTARTARPSSTASCSISQRVDRVLAAAALAAAGSGLT